MQSFITIDSPFYLKEEELASPAPWGEIFGNDHPLVLEIGCGIGDFVVKTAADHPEWNYIALDFYNKGCFKTCRRVERHGLTNVRVARDEARHFITSHIAPATLRGVHINCPDPWPKRKHRKRRLVSEEFVAFLRGYLAPGGEFHFATDFADYGLDVAGFMPRVAGLDNLLAPDLYRHQRDDYHLSKYMLKFMAEGSRIHFVHYRKSASP